MVLEFKVDHLIPNLMNQIRQFENENAPKEIKLWILKEPRLGGNHTPKKERYHQIILPIIYQVIGENLRKEEISYHRICDRFFFYVKDNGEFTKYYGKSLPQLKESIIVEENLAKYLTHKKETIRKLVNLTLRDPDLTETFEDKLSFKNLGELADYLCNEYDLKEEHISKSAGITLFNDTYRIRFHANIRGRTQDELKEAFKKIKEEAFLFNEELKGVYRINLDCYGELGNDNFKIQRTYPEESFNPKRKIITFDMHLALFGKVTTKEVQEKGIERIKLYEKFKEKIEELNLKLNYASFHLKIAPKGGNFEIKITNPYNGWGSRYYNDKFKLRSEKELKKFLNAMIKKLEEPTAVRSLGTTDIRKWRTF